MSRPSEPAARSTRPIRWTLRATLALCLGLGAGLGGSAFGHPSHLATGIERYIKLVVGGGRGRLVYTLSFGEQRAVAERLRADADRNGWVSEVERDAYADEAAHTIGRGVALRIDGRRARLTFGRPWVEPLLGRPRPGALTVELTASLPPVGGRGRSVCLRDTNRFDTLVRTELGVEAAPGVVLVRAGSTDSPHGIEPYEAIREAIGASAPRVVCAVVDAPAIRERPGATTRRRVVRIGAGIAAVGLFALLLWRVRRQRMT